MENPSDTVHCVGMGFGDTAALHSIKEKTMSHLVRLLSDPAVSMLGLVSLAFFAFVGALGYRSKKGHRWPIWAGCTAAALVATAPLVLRLV